MRIITQIFVTIVVLFITNVHAEGEREPVPLNCVISGLSMDFLDGGRKVLPGGLEELKCGGDIIELEAKTITDSFIATKEYGRIKLDISTLTSTTTTFLLTEKQKEHFKKYFAGN